MMRRKPQEKFKQSGNMRARIDVPIRQDGTGFPEGWFSLRRGIIQLAWISMTCFLFLIAYHIECVREIFGDKNFGKGILSSWSFTTLFKSEEDLALPSTLHP